MKIIIIGGDERMVQLYKMLTKDGHSVFPVAMERALPLQGPPDWAGAELAILPLPAERGGRLNTPLSEGEYCASDFLALLPEGCRVFAGMAGEKLRESCLRRGLIPEDYFLREELQVKNAALTAEGALGLLLGADGRSLAGRRVLICGFGRIGRLVGLRLKAVGAELCVAARSAADRAWAEAMGFAAVKLGEVSGEYDFVLNTVPAPVLGRRELERVGRAILVELASAPYGIDRSAAEELGLRLIMASGLPALTAPESAAEAIKDSIYNILEE